jgi:hypothetical protein
MAPRHGKTQKRWTKIGAAFPHKEGPGFSIKLKALPLDGRLVVLPPDNNDDRSPPIGQRANYFGALAVPFFTDNLNVRISAGICVVTFS